MRHTLKMAFNVLGGISKLMGNFDSFKKISVELEVVAVKETD